MNYVKGKLEAQIGSNEFTIEEKDNESVILTFMEHMSNTGMNHIFVQIQKNIYAISFTELEDIVQKLNSIKIKRNSIQATALFTQTPLPEKDSKIFLYELPAIDMEYLIGKVEAKIGIDEFTIEQESSTTAILTFPKQLPDQGF